jgi:hypothetical protein
MYFPERATFAASQHPCAWQRLQFVSAPECRLCLLPRGYLSSEALSLSSSRHFAVRWYRSALLCLFSVSSPAFCHLLQFWVVALSISLRVAAFCTLEPLPRRVRASVELRQTQSRPIVRLAATCLFDGLPILSTLRYQGTRRTSIDRRATPLFALRFDPPNTISPEPRSSISFLFAVVTANSYSSSAGTVPNIVPLIIRNSPN